MENVETIIITGGGGHLGCSVARWWAKPGIHLILIDRDPKRLDAARTVLVALGADVTLMAIDIAAPNALKAATASLPAALWRYPPSLVLAHALSGKGAGRRSPRLGSLDHDHWQEVIDINLTSVVFAIEVFLPFMKQAGGGRIVIVSSTAGLSASPTAALSYAVSKASVGALPRLLAPELALSRILINAVAPGKFFNPDWPDDPDKVKCYARSVPLGRIASADEVAALVGFLSSGTNTYVTGQTILQDGGRLSAMPTAEQS
jgi:3-oxoacyl-[acyl-carrier protein] reductase